MIAPRDPDRGRLGDETAVRYNALPDRTRRLLENMRDDDVDRLDAMLTLLREEGVERLRASIEMARWFAGFNRATKALILGAIGVFGAVATFLTAWDQFVKWLHAK